MLLSFIKASSLFTNISGLSCTNQVIFGSFLTVCILLWEIIMIIINVIKLPIIEPPCQMPEHPVAVLYRLRQSADSGDIAAAAAAAARAPSWCVNVTCYCTRATNHYTMMPSEVHRSERWTLETVYFIYDPTLLVLSAVHGPVLPVTYNTLNSLALENPVPTCTNAAVAATDLIGSAACYQQC